MEMNLGNFKTTAIQQLLESLGITKAANLGREKIKWMEYMGEEGKQEDRDTFMSVSLAANHGMSITSLLSSQWESVKCVLFRHLRM